MDKSYHRAVLPWMRDRQTRRLQAMVPRAGDISMVGTLLGGASGAIGSLRGGGFTGVSDTPDPTPLGTLYLAARTDSAG